MKKRRTGKSCPIINACEVCDRWISKCETLHMQEVHGMSKGWGECELHIEK